jgi:hypothetical protein
MACRTRRLDSNGWPEEAVKSGCNGVLVDVDDVTGLAHGREWVLSMEKLVRECLRDGLGRFLGGKCEDV